MADIQLRQQFPAPPDLSVGVDIADNDIWLREQFPAPSDLSCYPTQWGIREGPAAPVIVRAILAAREAADIFAAAVSSRIAASMAAVEASDTFTGAMTAAGDPAADTAQTGAGGSRRRRRFASRREFTIGDKKYAIESDGQLDRLIAEKVSKPVRIARVPESAPAVRVNLEPSTPLVTWEPPEFHMPALQAVRAQSVRLEQDAVIEAIDRLIARRQAIIDDENDVELLLLH